MVSAQERLSRSFTRSSHTYTRTERTEISKTRGGETTREVRVEESTRLAGDPFPFGGFLGSFAPLARPQEGGCWGHACVCVRCRWGWCAREGVARGLCLHEGCVCTGASECACAGAVFGLVHRNVLAQELGVQGRGLHKGWLGLHKGRVLAWGRGIHWCIGMCLHRGWVCKGEACTRDGRARTRALCALVHQNVLAQGL